MQDIQFSYVFGGFIGRIKGIIDLGEEYERKAANDPVPL